MIKTFFKLEVIALLCLMLFGCNEGSNPGTSNGSQNVQQLAYAPATGSMKARLSRGFQASPGHSLGLGDNSGEVDIHFPVATTLTQNSISFYGSSDCSGTANYSTSLGLPTMAGAGDYWIDSSASYNLCSIFGGSGVNDVNCANEKATTKSILLDFQFSSPAVGHISYCLNSATNPLLPGNYGEVIANYNGSLACTNAQKSNCGLSKNYFVPVYADGSISESMSSSSVYQGSSVNINLQLNNISPSKPQNITAAVLNQSGAIESTIRVVYPAGSNNFCSLTSSDLNCTISLSTTWAHTPFGVYTVQLQNATLNGVPVAESTLLINIVGSSIFLPQTGENPTANYCTGMVDAYESTIDCHLQAGINLPLYAQRFESTSTPGVLYDTLLQKYWQSSPIIYQSSYNLAWPTAISAIASSHAGGRSWRLPTVNELKSLLNYDNLAYLGSTAALLNSAGFSNVQSTYYWTSSLYSGITTDSYLPVWLVQLGPAFGQNPNPTENNIDGLAVPSDTIAGGGAESLLYGALAISDALSPLPPSNITPALTPQTGESINAPICTGNINKNSLPATGSECTLTQGPGVVLPQNRFIPVGIPAGSCMLDTLTGLTWLANPTQNSSFQTNDWYDGLIAIMSANESGGYCGYTDWRMPNINELSSLINYGVVNPVAWLGTQGFTLDITQDYYYWTSSIIYGDDIGGLGGWLVDMVDGSVGGYQDLFSPGNVWPVRGGV